MVTCQWIVHERRGRMGVIWKYPKAGTSSWLPWQRVIPAFTVPSVRAPSGLDWTGDWLLWGEGAKLFKNTASLPEEAEPHVGDEWLTVL